LPGDRTTNEHVLLSPPLFRLHAVTCVSTSLHGKKTRSFLLHAIIIIVVIILQPAGFLFLFFSPFAAQTTFPAKPGDCVTCVIRIVSPVSTTFHQAVFALPPKFPSTLGSLFGLAHPLCALIRPSTSYIHIADARQRFVTAVSPSEMSCKEREGKRRSLTVPFVSRLPVPPPVKGSLARGTECSDDFVLGLATTPHHLFIYFFP